MFRSFFKQHRHPELAGTEHCIYTDLSPQVITVRHLHLQGVLEHDIYGGLKAWPLFPLQQLMDNLTDSSSAYFPHSFLVSFLKMLKATMPLRHVIILLTTVCHLIQGAHQCETKYLEWAPNKICHCWDAAEDYSEKEEKQDLIFWQRFKVVEIWCNWPRQDLLGILINILWGNIFVEVMMPFRKCH